MIKRETIQELKDKLDAVFQAYVRIEDNIRKEIGDISWEEIPKSEASKAYYYLEYMLANFSRQSFLTMVCSWLEMAMDVIGEAFILDYMKKVEYKDNEKRRKGSWFDKRVLVFRKYCDAFNKEMSYECQFIKHVLKVRNCIVHVGGEARKDKNPEQVEIAVKWLWDNAKERNESYANFSKGLIYLGDNIISEVVIVSEAIIDHLWDQAGKESE